MNDCMGIIYIIYGVRYDSYRGVGWITFQTIFIYNVHLFRVYVFMYNYLVPVDVSTVYWQMLAVADHMTENATMYFMVCDDGDRGISKNRQMPKSQSLTLGLFRHDLELAGKTREYTKQ